MIKGELPKGWELTALGEAADNLDGMRVPLNMSDRDQRHGEYPYYGASGVIDQIDDFLFDGDYLLVAEDGANLLARSTPIAFLASGRFWVNNHAHVLSFNGKASLSYLKRYLCSIDISPFVTGSAQPKLNQKNLDRIEIPLPPLSEQKRIADILDKADAIRRKRQAAIDGLLQIPGSAFHAMFGTPVHNTKGWKIGTIRDLVEEVKYGSSSKASAVGKYPMLRMNNITYEGTWNLSDLKYIDLDEKDLPKYLARKGDILFNRTNSKELVGKTAVFQEDIPMAFAGYLVRARTNELAHPDYISGYLNSPHGKATLRHMCKNIVGMANINAQSFQDILIPHPPIEVQLEYVRLLNGVRQSEKPLRRAFNESAFFFHSLVQRAFKGEL